MAADAGVPGPGGGSRLALRFAAASVMLAAAITAVLGAAAYQLAHRQLAATHDAQLRADATLFAEHLEGILDPISGTMAALAQNSMIATALVDSAGKETYIIPFLQGFRQINGVPVSVAFTDFEGAPIATNGVAPVPPGDIAWLREVMEGRRPPADVVAGPDGRRDIRAAALIIYSRTRTPEGALLYRVPLSALPLGDRATLLHGAEGAGGAVPEADSVEAALELDPPLDGLGLRVRVGARQDAGGPGWMLPAFLAGGLLVVALAAALSYAMGRYLTRSLRELETLAGTVIRKGLVDSRARVAGRDAAGRDEAGRLVAAFNVMLDRLSEADAELRARARAEVEAQRANAAAAERARALAEQAGAEAEAARRQAERANAAKTKFLAAASHDLRQPFQSMRLFHHLLTGDPPPERRADALARLGEAMEAGEELLNALLDVSTLEAGQVTPKPQPVALEEVVAAEASQFAALAAEKGLRLRVAACRGAVMTDPILLKRMLRNLVANAVRYTERGGILVGCRRRGDRWRIEVWDTGIGIPEGQVRAIFEDFHQLGNPERDRSRGLGLGLSVVDRMARLLDHPVEVRSRPGRGSCFSISVPAVAEPAQPGAAPAGADAGPAARVLVVEDDAIQAIGLQMMLEDWGHRVERAPSGDAALEHVRAHGLPALLVTDYRLPGRLNGAALLREIRRLAGTAPAAVVVTGDTDPDCLREVARSGGVLLNKPYKAEALRRALADARAEAEQAQPAAATGR